jgi:5-methylcytosine-specific restriction enzyme A
MSEITLQPGSYLSNQELCDIFKVSTQGGMRRSLRTSSLVIVSNHVESIYHDRWEGDVLHYTGMGQTGDQKLDSAQNKTLNECSTNGVAVHYVETFAKNEYRYVGQVELAGEPYQERQPDKVGQRRLVWVFQLRVKGAALTTPIQVEKIRRVREKRESSIKKLSDSEIGNRVAHSPNAPGARMVLSKEYIRSEAVVEAALREANGICQLCDAPAPFLKKKNRKGDPFLEVHHIQWLAKKGNDTLDNAVALCPNCHRRVHNLDDNKDRSKLLAAKEKNRSLHPELYGLI